MLWGRFGESSGRPLIEGRILLPRLELETDATFLVDTGADNSHLMPADAERMGLDWGRLGGTSMGVGAGGAFRQFHERALVAFVEDGVGLHVYEVELSISHPDPDLRSVPSLLGRDVVDRSSRSCVS